MEGDQVGDEDISAPRGHHVEVGQSGQGGPERRAFLEGLDPEVKGKDEQEDGNGLVVVASGDRTGDVSWGDAHESSGQQAGRRGGRQLRREQVRCKSSQSRESGRQQYTDVSNVDWERKQTEDMIDDAAGDHQSGVEGATGDATQWMPCSCDE